MYKYPGRSDEDEREQDGGREREGLPAWSTVSTALHIASTTLGIASTAWRGLERRVCARRPGAQHRRQRRARRASPGAPEGPASAVTFFGAGVAVGAGIGVMFAPSSGADLRRAILGLRAT